MRIFFVSQRVPYPPDRGDKITTFHEIQHLSKSHDVHVFCLGDGAEDLKNTSGLATIVKSVDAVALSRPRAFLRLVKALFDGTPLSVAFFSEPKLHSIIRRKFRELSPDVIFVYSSNVAQFAEHFPHTPRIMQFGDLDSLKFQRYSQCFKLPKRWLYALEAKRLLRHERHVARTFSYSLLCTDSEKHDFDRLIGVSHIRVVRNGVDLEYYCPQGQTKRAGSIIFTGVMDYAPNVDAVVWFCDKIFPLVRRDVPEASFVICGKNPSSEVRALGTRPGITVTGQVPDTRGYMDVAKVFVAPLRIARGIQNKVLEALAMGLPVVSSKPTWEATRLPEGEGIVAAEDTSEFAHYVVRMLTDETYRASMAQRARLAVERNYTWAAQLKLLDQTISDVTNQAASSSVLHESYPGEVSLAVATSHQH